MPTQILFVCLGNICRSPTAHAVFQQYVAEAKLNDQIVVDSASTGDWHVGRAPDQRATRVAAKRGYDLSALRARCVQADDFQRFTMILAMDRSNLHDLRTLCPNEHDQHKLSLLLEYGNTGVTEVPDPYYGSNDEGFNYALDLIEQASEALLDHIKQQHSL